MPSRRQCIASLAATVFLGLLHPANADNWPSKPVKIISPFAAGGSADAMARLTAQHLSAAFGQPFIVEGRTGAGGTLAAEAVARAPADGYTLFWGTVNQIAIAPAISPTRYDPVKDFAPISIIGTYPFVLTVNDGLGADSVPAFIAKIRQQPNKIPYGAAGAGSLTHMLMALFLKRAGLEMIPVMYRGGAPAMIDLLSGQIKALFAPLPVALHTQLPGKAHMLVVSSEHRVPQIPNIPTLIESGFPGFKANTWNGLMAPAGTPHEIIDRIAKESAKVAKDPTVIGRFEKLGITMLGDTPAEFAAEIKASMALWKEAVATAGVKAK